MLFVAMVCFDPVADHYEAGRPGYPDEVFDALEPLAGARVLEGGAGTGIGTRGLLARGASVVPFDIGTEVLRRARARSPELPAVVADGGVLPFRDGCVDLVCFAQSWHWLDPRRRVVECARVLRRGGRWAGWWSHARCDGDAWFDDYWSLIEGACPGTNRTQRDIDWGSGLGSEHFSPALRVTVPWVRELSTALWIRDHESRSHVMGLPTAEREQLHGAVEVLLDRSFPTGTMRVRYETWLWLAQRQ